jgi:hypothetical protein
MSEQHTPGPWAIDGCGSLGTLDVIYGSGRITMMDCENDEINDGELFANARLIAAAPDLLAALQDIVQASNANDGDSLMNAIQAAIACVNNLVWKDTTNG